MKTAEEWAKEYESKYRQLDAEADRVVGGGVLNSEDIHEIIIKQIQLDALKEGMRRAADLFGNPDCKNYTQYNKDIVSEILTAAEQLTEKDL